MTLRIVGGSPPPEVEALGERPNVVVTGYVPDVAPTMSPRRRLRRPAARRRRYAAEDPRVARLRRADGVDDDRRRRARPESLASTSWSATTRRAFADQVVALLAIVSSVIAPEATRAEQRSRTRYSWQAVGQRLEAAIDQLTSRRSVDAGEAQSCTDDPGGDPCHERAPGNVGRHDASGCHAAVGADRGAARDDHAGADPDVVLDDDRTRTAVARSVAPVRCDGSRCRAASCADRCGSGHRSARARSRRWSTRRSRTC